MRREGAFRQHRSASRPAAAVPLGEIPIFHPSRLPVPPSPSRQPSATPKAGPPRDAPRDHQKPFGQSRHRRAWAPSLRRRWTHARRLD